VNRRAALLSVVVLTATLTGAAGTVAGNTATAYPDPVDACQGESQHLVVLLENGEVRDDELHVFTNTTARAVLCTEDADGGSSPEPTSAWGLSSFDGIDVVGEGDRWVAFETNRAVGQTDLSTHIDGRDAGNTEAPDLTVVGTAGTRTGEVETPSTVRFSEDDRRRQFVDARENYSATVAAAEDLAATYDEAADAESPAEALDAETITDHRDRLAAVEATGEDAERALLRAAVDGDDRAAAAYFAQQNHRQETTDGLQDSVDGYIAAVESEAADARLFLTAVVLAPFAVGAAAGAVVGRYLSLGDLKDVRRRRRRDSSVGYGVTNLWKAIVGGLVAVAVGGGVLVAGVDPAALFEVML